MIALTDVRAGLAVGAVATALAIGGAAPALASSSGMAAEFPVGTCMDYPNDHLVLDDKDLTQVTAVSCADPARDYRVVAQVAHAPQCGTAVEWVYTTRDMVVLCVVQDGVVPVFGG
ncbi:hypothetical protein [Mycolicibacterium hodleri]|uniref:DUF4333 domain-containing protein n=1 Tax=Mycolicibacterium hodleri TaxID=49897 RepID=A0A502EEN7_9MYCO|nr:hypothetical protein [Mycolicibacterium hodleri]TPG35724.1 hypothetical protein EAH80_06555 [Mycolicibacterium hodleri]